MVSRNSHSEPHRSGTKEPEATLFIFFECKQRCACAVRRLPKLLCELHELLELFPAQGTGARGGGERRARAPAAP